MFFLSGHWDEQFHHKMVDNRGFMVSRSYTVSVQMMHRTGSWRHSYQLVQKHSLRLGMVEHFGKIKKLLLQRITGLEKVAPANPQTI